MLLWLYFSDRLKTVSCSVQSVCFVCWTWPVFNMVPSQKNKKRSDYCVNVLFCWMSNLSQVCGGLWHLCTGDLQKAQAAALKLNRENVCIQGTWWRLHRWNFFNLLAQFQSNRNWSNLQKIKSLLMWAHHPPFCWSKGQNLELQKNYTLWQNTMLPSLLLHMSRQINTNW